MKNDKTFKIQYIQHDHEKNPVICNPNDKENETDTEYYWGSRPMYYFVYGSNHKIKQTLSLSIFNSLDLIDIILQFCGDGELLFLMKKTTSGGMTLSTTTLSIDGDAFIISSTYSEKTGQSGFIKLSDKYDKKLYMYLGWIIYELSQWQYGYLWEQGSSSMGS